MLLLPEQRVPQMVPQFARRVPVGTTKLVVPVLDVDLDVVLVQEKQLLVLQRLIVFVPKTRAVVPTVPLLLEHRVPQTVPTFVHRVPVIITKLAVLALGVDLYVVLVQEK